MGDGEYSRRIYQFELEDGKKVNKFLLYEYLSMDTIGTFSINLAEKINEIKERKIKLNEKGVLKGKKKELKLAIAYTGWT